MSVVVLCRYKVCQLWGMLINIGALSFMENLNVH